MSAYEVVSSIMRYVFLGTLLYFIALLIVRSISEWRYLRMAQRILQLSIHWILVIEPEKYRGKWFPLKEYNDIGSGSECEIPLAQTELKARHARIVLKNGEYRFSTKKRRYCEINGQPVIRQETPLEDGDIIWIQDVCFTCHRTRGKEGLDDA